MHSLIHWRVSQRTNSLTHSLGTRIVLARPNHSTNSIKNIGLAIYNCSKRIWINERSSTLQILIYSRYLVGVKHKCVDTMFAARRAYLPQGSPMFTKPPWVVVGRRMSFHVITSRPKSFQVPWVDATKDNQRFVFWGSTTPRDIRTNTEYA